jgi:hypothetical protein
MSICDKINYPSQQIQKEIRSIKMVQKYKNLDAEEKDIQDSFNRGEWISKNENLD